jgi:hypothetical protein
MKWRNSKTKKKTLILKVKGFKIIILQIYATNRLAGLQIWVHIWKNVQKTDVYRIATINRFIKEI